ncbi:MAG: hypothetical protein M1817_000660 [Caeruleum heppii]|nr:MAG: hypothetical protein M1817_000660 [Caeruleum heppii]
MADIEDRAYFQAIPWCAQLLAESGYTVARTASREPKHSTEDEFFAKTLNNSDIICACLTQCKDPRLAPDPVTGAITPRVDEVRIFLSLRPGVNGYPHVCHGGVVATIMDEACGSLMSANKDLYDVTVVREAAVTAKLSVSFLKPVKTPQTVLVTARLREVRGKKCYVDAELNDSNGVVLATAETLWITVRDLKASL